MAEREQHHLIETNPPDATTPNPSPNRIIAGRYRIEKLLGRGGMSHVYLAYDLNTDKQCAIKLRHNEEVYAYSDGTSSLQKEYEYTKTLDHPGIIKVIDYSCDPQSCEEYIVMQPVQGSLADRLEELRKIDQPMTVAEIQRIFGPLCDVINYIHDQKIVHRDLKPANILLDEQGQIKLIDFGIAKDISDTTHHTGMVGTRTYMAPEQLLRGEKVTHHCDIYALGIILFQLFVGDEHFAVWRKKEEKQGILPSRYLQKLREQGQSSWPAGMDRIIAKALSKSPRDRYPTALALSQAFSEAISNPTKPLRSRRYLVLGVSFVIVIVGILVWLWNKTPLQVHVLTAGQKAGEIRPISNQIPWKMVWIPGGIFKMGSDPRWKQLYHKDVVPKKYPIAYPDESPQTTVVLQRGYWMQQTEVTQKQFTQIMGYNPSFFKQCGETCPVEHLTHDEAMAFCNRLSKLHQLPPCFACTGKGRNVRCKIRREYQGNGNRDIYHCLGFRLPTEAEWERAARARNRGVFIDSSIFSIRGHYNSPEIHPFAWYGGNSGATYPGAADCRGWPEKQYPSTHCGPQPVGQKVPNEWGLYDMQGNVWEMCLDQYTEFLPGGRVTDPVMTASPPKQSVPDVGLVKRDVPVEPVHTILKYSVRGAGWLTRAYDVRFANRYYLNRGQKDYDAGFRVIKIQP